MITQLCRGKYVNLRKYFEKDIKLHFFFLNFYGFSSFHIVINLIVRGWLGPSLIRSMEEAKEKILLKLEQKIIYFYI